VTSYAADLNGDGKTDILAVPVITGNPFLGDPVQFALTVFLNQGGWSFASAGTFPVAPPTSGNFVGVNFFAPVVVDLNGDGKPDLVTQNETIGATQTDGVLQVDVLLNNGNGTFGSPMPVTIPDPPNYTGGPWAYETAFGDVNGDGKQDLI
jgi:FG-GAP-like repeat